VVLTAASQELAFRNTRQATGYCGGRSILHRTGATELAALLNTSVFHPNPVPSTSFWRMAFLLAGIFVSEKNRTRSLCTVEIQR
jgi:hypothetical protein